MALINCKECNKQISDMAKACPNCGAPLNAENVVEQKKVENVTPKKAEDLLQCPKCKSAHLTSNQKGFSGKQAVAGAVLTGGIGLLAGTIGSSNVIVTCLKCGHKYKAGEYEKERQKFLEKEKTDRIFNEKVARGEQSYAGTAIVFLVLTIIGIIISYNLWNNGWNFLGFIFSVATLLCGAMCGFSFFSEYERNEKK